MYRLSMRSARVLPLSRYTCKMHPAAVSERRTHLAGVETNGLHMLREEVLRVGVGRQPAGGRCARRAVHVDAARGWLADFERGGARASDVRARDGGSVRRALHLLCGMEKNGTGRCVVVRRALLGRIGAGRKRQ